MFRITFVLAFLTALLISACSFTKPQAPKIGLPSLEGEWTIQMNHSGGIMGLSRSIDISANGKYTVIDHRSGRSVTKELGSEQLSKLKEIAANSEYITKESPQPSVCADCFVYDLAIQGNGGKFRVQLDDISTPDSGMENLITFLRDLMDSALK